MHFRHRSIIQRVTTLCVLTIATLCLTPGAFAQEQSVLQALEVYWSRVENNPDSARAELEAFQETVLRDGDREAESAWYHVYGYAFDLAGDYRSAIEQYEKAREGYAGLGMTSKEAEVYKDIGLNYYFLAEYSIALDQMLDGLFLVDRSEADSALVSKLLFNIGNVHQAREDHDKAIEFFERALAIDEAQGNAFGVAAVAANLSSSFIKEGNAEASLEASLRAQRAAEEIGDNYIRAAAVGNEAEVYLIRGELNLAEERFRETLGLAKKIGEVPIEITAMIRIALVRSQTGDYVAALRYAEDALSLASASELREEARQAASVVQEALAKLGRFDEAYEVLSQYVSLNEQIFNSDKSEEIARREAEFEYARQAVLQEEKEKRERILLFGALVIIGGAFYVRTLGAKNRLIEQKNVENESLLLNILPRPIAQRLKSGEEKIADAFHNVSVLFADIVGFTTISAKMRPEDVVHMLNDLISDFDKACAECGVEKIKTIGDAYMAVAGLPERAPDHAERVVKFAIRMFESVKAYNEAHGTDLNIRVGINSGPVVAGVIGTSKFIYDLWGDAVNTASRMESHGVPGRIHISKSTESEVAGRFEIERRGEITVKGKGSMETYFVAGSHELVVPA